MNVVKAFIRRLPGGREWLERSSYRRRARKLARIGSTEDRFTHIFEHNQWKDAESRSGAGSSLAATTRIRSWLPELCATLDVGTVFDAPCGDFNWFRHVERPPSLQYIGADIVQALIDANRSAFADERTRFEHLDILCDDLPQADLWLCRDCLIHFSFDDIARTLENFQRSTIRYWLVTSHRRIERNIDIPTGHCRLLNLEIEPFHFPAPLQWFDDDDFERTGKALGLWEHAQLAKHALSRRSIS